jgi:hypothetical protein
MSIAEMALEVLKIHDADFASRPSSIIGKYVGFEYSDIVFSPYGDTWCLLRKICATELFTRARLKTFEFGHQEEVACMVEKIAKYNQERKVMKLRPIFHELTSNNICRMLFGKYHEKSDCFLKKEFDELVDRVIEMGEVGGKFNISDLIPILKPFDVQGLERHMKHIRNRVENSLSIILNKYQNGNKMVTDSTVTNFVETLLSHDGKLDERSIMGVLAVRTHHCSPFILTRCVCNIPSMFINVVLCMLFLVHDCCFFVTRYAWRRNKFICNQHGMGINELICHPKIMKRAQEELDTIVGMTRLVLM